jgi:murein DD-endopeptidase MepM/ murein hydrolase activator NlpD
VQIPKAWIRNAVWVAGLVTLTGLATFADWVRLRIDSVEIEAMREQTAADEVRLVDLAGQLHGLEQQLEKLREFERKVRMIADLPSAIPEVATTQAIGGEAAPRAGEGGPEGPEPESAPAEGMPGDSAPEEPLPPAAQTPPGPALGLDEAALARIARKAARLSGRASKRGHSFEELLGQLDGKSRQLASTPSISPADGWVTSSFGYRVSPFTGRRHFHAGLDIAADFGTPIVAPASGRVSFAGRKGALGKTIVVDHGYGLQTTYGHAAELFVRRGEQVDRGQRLAAVGSTGRSTGPHLHYVVKARGTVVDPADYILD